MTATALAYDLAFDLAPEPTHRRRLAVLPGGVGPGDSPLTVSAVEPGVEIYRRRRFMAALALTAIVLLAAQLAGLSLTSFGPVSDGVEASTPVVHVVAPGDTYGAIAASLGADDPQAFALTLQAANADAELIAGQRLVVDRAALGVGK